MRSRRAVRQVVVAGVLACMAVASTAPAALGAEKPKRGGSMTWLISQEATNMDPIVVGVASTPSAYSVYDRLIYIDPQTGHAVPGLALSVTPSADAKVWTIKLRPNVKFTDGTTLDAEAVKFNWDRVKNSTTATDRSVVQGFTSYDVVDPTTLRVTLPTAIGSFPALLQRSLGLIASPTAITKAGSSYGATPATIVGAGPFKVSEWVRDDHMTLVRSDNYWGAPKPYLDTLVLKPVPDSTQKANTLVAGQADMAWLPALSSADQVLTGAGVKSASVVQDGGIAIVYNTSKPPLNDVRVRKALTLAVDLEDLNAKSAAGLATMVQTFAPKGSPAYDPTVKQQTNKLAQAQKLIDAYVADHGGTPVSFNLLYSTSLKSWGDATLQQWSRLKNFNVTANLATPTVASAQGQAGNFDAWYASTTAARLTQFPETYYLLYRSGQATNLQKYSNPTLDKVLDANRDAVTAAERGQALQKISKVLVDDAAFTMIYRLAQRTYYTGRVHGVEMIDQSFPGTTTLWVGS